MQQKVDYHTCCGGCWYRSYRTELIIGVVEVVGDSVVNVVGTLYKQN